MTSVREDETTQQPAVYPFIEHLARRFGCTRILELTPAMLLGRDLQGNPGAEDAAAVCFFEHELDSPRVREALHRLADEARVVVVSTASDLDSLDVEFRGQNLAVLSRGNDGTPPTAFSAVAFITAYNEADIIGSTIEHLLAEGLGVYLIDNWSTDGTWEIAQGFVSRGLVGVERFPLDGPGPHFELRALLRRVEELAVTIRADWFVHVDADERRESPWPAISLREGLWRVDRRGFNAVDHTILTFPSVDEGFEHGSDPERYFRHFEFGRNPGHFRQIKAWKRGNRRVDLATEGGHDVSFEGRRIFPFNFLTKHYPIRSQAHGERKVLRERQSRWSPAERADGWHIQYDLLRPGQSFLHDPATLELFDADDFHRRYLVERLTRVGIPRPKALR